MTRAALILALSALAALVGAVQARGRLTGPVTHVRDGDTIVVAGQPVQLSALDCPERDESGEAAATALMRCLTGGMTETCALDGNRGYDRVAGYCAARGRDLGQ